MKQLTIRVNGNVSIKNNSEIYDGTKWELFIDPGTDKLKQSVVTLTQKRSHTTAELYINGKFSAMWTLEEK